jgi:protein-S-isoprenylcysteine O-methyltransferase Ste14
MPVSKLDLWIFWAGAVIYGLVVLAARIGATRAGHSANARSRRSIGGIALQTLGIALAGIGAIHIGLPNAAPRSIAAGVVIAALLLNAAALFYWSAETMGKNWSLVARTREDHELVTSGPFAYVRHPIYVSMLMFLLALAVATGHAANLLWAVPVFAVGTVIRISEEEKLLRAAFGDAFESYVRRTGAFFPIR